MSFFGLVLLGTVFAFGLCMQLLIAPLTLSNQLGVNCAAYSEKAIVDMYANYLAFENDSFPVYALANTSGVYASCMHGICISANKYHTLVKAVATT